MNVTVAEPLNFGVIPVSQKVEKILRLKNRSKIPTVFQIRKIGKPANCIFTPMSARIPPFDQAEILVTYQNGENMTNMFKTKFPIDVVGCETLMIPFSVQTKVPDITIV